MTRGSGRPWRRLWRRRPVTRAWPGSERGSERSCKAPGLCARGRVHATNLRVCVISQNPDATILRVCVIFEPEWAKKSFIPAILLHFSGKNRSYPSNRCRGVPENHSYPSNRCRPAQLTIRRRLHPMYQRNDMSACRNKHPEQEDSPSYLTVVCDLELILKFQYDTICCGADYMSACLCCVL